MRNQPASWPSSDSKTVRKMLTLGHYRFGMFLRHKAREIGAIVLSVNEAYTSKTVSWTGELLEGLGGASVVVAQDGERMDRDYNGARGIYLRALGDISALRALALRVRRERERLVSAPAEM